MSTRMDTEDASRIVERWEGCYRESWQEGDLVPDAFAHPAKVSKALAFRLVHHLIAQGYLTPGQTVLDPFAGIAGFALPCLAAGLGYLGIELEPRFVDLANGYDCDGTMRADFKARCGKRLELHTPHHVEGNFDLWQRRYGFTGGTVVQGDSREVLRTMRGGVQGLVSSPPYAEAIRNGANSIDKSKGVDPRKPESKSVQRLTNLAEGYGTTPGQLGAMPAGVVGSPPYEGICVERDREAEAFWAKDRTFRQGKTRGQHSAHQYGVSEGQLGGTEADTFWGASAQILNELHALLPAGAVCAWVLKDYIKRGTRVPFCRQWEALCHQQGFTTAEWIEASLVEEHGTQHTLFGEAESIQTARRSFFRTLHVKKYPHLAINEEIVLITRKPHAESPA
jgi:hypothetical protein